MRSPTIARKALHPMRIGLIGLGRIGAFHADTLAALTAVDELVVTDPVAAAVDAVTGRIAKARAVDSPEALSTPASTGSSSPPPPTPTPSSSSPPPAAASPPSAKSRSRAPLTRPSSCVTGWRGRTCRSKSATRAASTLRSWPRETLSATAASVRSRRCAPPPSTRRLPGDLPSRLRRHLPRLRHP